MRDNLYIEPKVSVIMPTYNGTKFLQEAIFSILQQDYKNMEVLICDDASKDNTRELIQEIKQYHDHNNQIHIITQSHNQWISKNMNTWLEAATGKYVAILDQDDIRTDSNKLSKQIMFLENNQDHQIVWTNAIFDIYWSLQKRTYPLTDEHIRNSILGSCPMLHSSVMYNKEFVRKIGWYSESHKYAMDYKLFLDLLKLWKWANLKEETTYYRRHGNNTSIIKAKEQRDEAKNIRKEHKSNFPNWTKTMICHKTISLLNDIFGDNPTYVKLKNEAKKIYTRTQNSL